MNPRRGVLVVDDDPFIRKLVSTTLEDVARIELHEAADGNEALLIARRQRPTLVFLDIDMPGANGLDVCRRLREDPATSHATIVMLTAAQGDSVQGRARDAGADLFLTKPFSPLDLLRLVDELGEPAPPRDGASAASRASGFRPEPRNGGSAEPRTPDARR